MACVKRQETGCCSHTQCPFSWLKDLECVEVRWAEGRGFCEIGLDCVQACEFSYPYELEETAQKAFTDDHLEVEFFKVHDLDPKQISPNE